MIRAKGAVADKAAMATISNILHAARVDSQKSEIPGPAVAWREWVAHTLDEWESEARRFDSLAQEGEPFTAGVVKGLKEIHDSEAYMRNREIESAEEEGREPELHNGFPENLTHARRVAMSCDLSARDGPKHLF